MKFYIEEQVFSLAPELVVVLPIITDFRNELKPEQEQDFRELIASIVGDFLKSNQSEEQLIQHPFIKVYLDLIARLQLNNKKIAPTHLNLAKVVLKTGKLPQISPVVDLYNAISLKYITPFGGEDLSKLYGDFYLTLAQGNEQWYGINDNKSKPPEKGELIWRDDYDVSTRGLNWRQSERTKLTHESTNGYFIMECFTDINLGNSKTAAAEFCELFTNYFSGQAEIHELSSNTPQIEIDFQTKDPNNISEERKVTRAQTNIKKNTFSHTDLDLSDKLNEPHSLKTKLMDVIMNGLEGKYQLEKEPELEHPKDKSFGDFSTNLALQKANQLITNPRQLAEEIVAQLKQTDKIKQLCEKIEIAGPGFINFYLNQDVLTKELKNLIKEEEAYVNNVKQDQEWHLEHTSPNPNKAMHLGHLRNNIVGMAFNSLWKGLGVNVITECMNNNRGIAIARLMWGYLKFARRDDREITDLQYWYEHQDEWHTPNSAGERPDKFMDKLYTQGAADSKTPENQQKVKQLVIDWEQGDRYNRALWEKVLSYVYAGQQLTLKRLGNQWDYIWNESDHYEKGRDLILQGIKEGIFVESEGAVISNLESYGLPDAIMIKSDGTTLYHTQDIALNQLKMNYKNPDMLFWVVGPEQSLYLQQLFAITEQLGITTRDKLMHIAYGYMSIKGQGKMSSRLGNVVYIDDLIDLVKEEIMQKFSGENLTPEEQEETSEILAVSAIKYAILSVARMTNMSFDLESSVSLEGNSGPYLNYTYARARSILAKAKVTKEALVGLENITFASNAESELVRELYKLPEVAYSAGSKLSPNILTEYLFGIAQLFNAFYKNTPVLSAENETLRDNRLLLTAATATTLKVGSGLLGIKLVEQM